MAKRTITSKPEYTLIGIDVLTYRARVDAAINYEVKDKRMRFDDTLIYRFYSAIEVDGIANYPEERLGDNYTITIYSDERYPGEFTSKVSDYHVRDEQGLPKYRRERGESVPVYDIPSKIGYLERRRGTRTWSGVVWIDRHLVTDMLTLLPHVRPLYLAVNEIKVERRRGITGLTLQTTNPAEE